MRLSEPADDRARAPPPRPLPAAAVQARPDQQLDPRARRELRRRARSTASTSRASTRARSSTRPPTPASTGSSPRASRRRGSRTRGSRPRPIACCAPTATGSPGTPPSTRSPTSRRCRSPRGWSTSSPRASARCASCCSPPTTTAPRADRHVRRRPVRAGPRARADPVPGLALPPRHAQRRRARRLQPRVPPAGLPDSPLPPDPAPSGFRWGRRGARDAAGVSRGRGSRGSGSRGTVTVDSRRSSTETRLWRSRPWRSAPPRDICARGIDRECTCVGEPEWEEAAGARGDRGPWRWRPSASASRSPRGRSPALAGSQVPASVAETIARVQSQPLYQHSTWGLMVADAATGEVLLAQNAESMFVPGSIMKTFSAANALNAYGPDARFRTPVFRTGEVRDGTLNGDSVLVASGDFSFGLRDRPNGTLGLQEPARDRPQLCRPRPAGSGAAAQLEPTGRGHPARAAGAAVGDPQGAGRRRHRRPALQAFDGWPDGLISPIWVNENVIDITVTPTRLGRAARVSWRPKTSAWRVRRRSRRGAGTRVDSQVGRPGRLSCASAVASQPAARLVVQIPDPRPAGFARTAFIEALRRAGVAVAAKATGRNPEQLLPRGRPTA